MKMLCQPAADGVCVQCGQPLPAGHRRTCQRGPRQESPPPPEKLGDWTERQLKRIGVTEDRYKEAKERFGLDPNCACPQRKAWLNSVSDWWRGVSAEDQPQDK